jgi:L-ascorbate metabolism protein UlaG (beta-lactamase superfamily)
MRTRTKVGLAVLAGAAGAAAWALRDVPAALGAHPSGERAERLRRSAHFRDGTFHNTMPTRMMTAAEAPSTLRALLFGKEKRKPDGLVPLVTTVPAPATSGLHLTWYGHASVLVELSGSRVLLDPVWSERCSPSQLAGPRRLHPVPVPLTSLPTVDAVVISHDHYDHLDLATIRALAEMSAAPFVVPLGVGAHLARWGVPESRIVELDWDESFEAGALRLTATEARHFSGRTTSRDYTLWSSWVIAGDDRSVFYTGDSGYFDGYPGIGENYGPFDATLMQIGAYGPSWPQIHMFPEEAVAAHLDLRGGLLLPVHWGTFNLAFHAWSEPIDRLWREAKARGVAFAVPRPGQRVDVDDPGPVDNWWQPLS